MVDTHLRSNSKFGERLQKPPISDGSGGLHHGPTSRLDVGVQTRALVEVSSREVQLPKVSRIVHVV